jgi:hypothetical protein
VVGLVVVEEAKEVVLGEEEGQICWKRWRRV